MDTISTLIISSFVIFIALFKRKLLINKSSFRIILGISGILFLTGLVLHFSELGRNFLPGDLLVPLITLGYYRLCHKVFIKRFNREPIDTTFDLSKAMGADRLFDIVYFMVAGWLFLFVPIGMAELAKRGL